MTDSNQTSRPYGYSIHVEPRFGKRPKLWRYNTENQLQAIATFLDNETAEIFKADLEMMQWKSQ